MSAAPNLFPSPAPAVAGIGELLWDLLPSGPRPGGAPGNFASHAAALGAQAFLISRVGEDEAGKGLIEEIKRAGVSTLGITNDPGHETGKVTVALDSHGVPHYEIARDVAWDHLVATREIRRLMPELDAIGFGTLAQRSPESSRTIRQLVGLTRPEALRVLDLNLRVEPYPSAIVRESLALANVVKLNEEELEIISGDLSLTGDRRQRLARLLTEHRLRLVALTLGEEGSLLHDGRDWTAQPGIVVEAIDTVGAGDSFLAAVTMGLLNGWPLDDIARRANAIAAFVCSQSGAVPPLPHELSDAFRNRQASPGALVCDRPHQ